MKMLRSWGGFFGGILLLAAIQACELAGGPSDAVRAVVEVTEDVTSTAPAVVRFDARESTSSAGDVRSFEWTVNGVVQPESGPILDRYFARAGSYDVTVEVRDDRGNAAEARAEVRLEQAESPFRIEVRFFDDETMTLNQRRAFAAAARRWAEVIHSDLRPITYRKPAGECDVPDAFSGTIDDVLIFASLNDLDGPGRILAQAGPCDADADLMPIYGIMQFDRADLPILTGNSDFEGVVLHEMGHVLGIGTFWLVPELGVLDPPGCFGEPDPRYVGANAVREWRRYGGTGDVPVEPGPDNGTACGHWREAPSAPDLWNELMTGYLDAEMVLSRITIGSLDDLGYEVDYEAADPYSLFPPGAGLRDGDERDRVPLTERLVVPDLERERPVRR